MFLDRLRDTVRRHEMLTPGDVVVVAVSGGPDSMALLHGVAAIAPEFGLALHVAHFNHQLRPEAAADEAFVAAASTDLGFPYHGDAGDPRALVKPEGLSLEDAGRRLRYGFLSRVARNVGANAVATGHTLDDQAETVLMRLLRGSGLEGLAGIPAVRRDGDARIVRPLIDTTREEIMFFLRAVGARWREDATNSDVRIVRNRVRLVLLPTLEGYNPGVRRRLARVARLLRDEADAVEAMAASRIAAVLSGESGRVRVARGPFAALPVALQRRAVREAVRRVRGNLRALQFVHIEGVRKILLHGRAGSWIPLPGGVRATRVAAGAEVAIAPAERRSPVYRLAVPGTVLALEFGLHLQAQEIEPDLQGKPKSRSARDEILLDAARIGRELILRGPASGDRFAPAGMRGRTKLLADFLRDAKIPRHRRTAVPVLTTAEGAIVWIVGMRAAEGTSAETAGARAVRVVAHRLKA